MIWIQEAELTHDGDDVELPSDECLEVAVAAPVPDLGLVVDISLLQTRELQIHPLKSELEAVLLDATQSIVSCCHGEKYFSEGCVATFKVS